MLSTNYSYRFANRDMFMRFRGGGVGHKATRHVDHALSQDVYKTIHETIARTGDTNNNDGDEEREGEEEEEEEAEVADDNGEDGDKDEEALEEEEEGLDPVNDYGYNAL
jgi:hypothetical protein